MQIFHDSIFRWCNLFCARVENCHLVFRNSYLIFVLAISPDAMGRPSMTSTDIGLESLCSWIGSRLDVLSSTCAKKTWLTWSNGTTTRDGGYMPRAFQSNGSDFGQTYSFNTSSNWLKTSNVFLWQGLLGLLGLREGGAEIEMGLSWALTWLTCRRGLYGQFTIMCLKPPQ